MSSTAGWRLFLSVKATSKHVLSNSNCLARAPWNDEAIVLAKAVILFP
jgi:hypothetical protein